MNRKVNPKSLKNLSDRSAPDSPGETKSITVRVQNDLVEWLESLPGGKSYHARRAFKMYRESLEKAEVTTSELPQS